MTKREECVQAAATVLSEWIGLNKTDAANTASAAFDAILSVLEEPDEEMIERGFAAGESLNGNIPAIWTAMLTSLKGVDNGR